MFTKKQVWRLLIPLMAEQILNTLMGAADTVMVSNAGSAAISAVSLVDSLNVLLIFAFSAMATGGSIICAQYLGRGDKREANETGKQLLLTVFAISMLVFLVCASLRGPILQMIFGRVEEKVMQNARTYLLITAMSYPFIAMYNAGAALFRVDGNSRLPMLVSMISNGINVIGNAIMIFVLKWGVAGAAIATLISRAFCAVVILMRLRTPKQSIVICDLLRIRPQSGRILNIMAIGVPTGIENGMFQFGKLAIQSTVSTLGTVAIAAQAMTSVLIEFACYAQIGIGLGMMTIVGQCMGAGRVKEARSYILKLSGYAEIATIITCAILALMVKPITVLGGMEPAAAALTVQMVHVNCIVRPIIWTPSFIPAYGLRAAGDVRYSMILSTVSMWAFRVAIAILLIRVFGVGPMGVWLGMFADWTVRGIFFTLRFFSGKWAHNRVIQER